MLELGLPLEGHADNLAAALAGGVCLIWQKRRAPPHARGSPTDLPLAPIVLVPETPREHEASRARGFPSSSATTRPPPRPRRLRSSAPGSPPGDADLLAAAFHDVLHEPYRAPGCAAARGAPRAARSPGTAGVTLSGSGPSVVVWARKEAAADVAAELERASRRPRAPARDRGRGAHADDESPEAASELTARLGAPHRVSTNSPPIPAKRHSAALTDGVDRAPARAMLKAVGFTDEDLAKPLVGVATTWIETMPCNFNQRVLAKHVKDGIRAAGGTPIEFNTISVSDGVSMGTTGMRASLISREVIADSIELVVAGHLLDGLVCLVGCDKTIPGRRDGARPARHPGPRLLQRLDRARAATRAAT